MGFQVTFVIPLLFAQPLRKRVAMAEEEDNEEEVIPSPVPHGGLHGGNLAFAASTVMQCFLASTVAWFAEC